MKIQSRIFAPAKVAGEQQKIEAYLNGGEIYPTTIEIDLTQLCTRSCPACPFSARRAPGLTLQLPFLDRLFSILGPHTPGILLSGGEPTIVPHFAETVALARKKGFKEIAVISNGGNIHKPKVQDALLEHVTSIRFSMYDWQESDSGPFLQTLKKIETLRGRIEKEGSPLEIGAAILTRKEWNHRYAAVGSLAMNSGIHWLYFHPFCIDWETRRPIQADQTGVLEAIEKVRETAAKGVSIQVPVERYSKKPLYFEKLHGAHFLIQVGADGINYAGPECKYDEDSALIDLNEYLEDDFLWHAQRLKRLNGLHSGNYSFIGTKHRPPVFSDYIQQLIQLRSESGKKTIISSEDSFSYPCII